MRHFVEITVVCRYQTEENFIYDPANGVKEFVDPKTGYLRLPIVCCNYRFFREFTGNQEAGYQEGKWWVSHVDHFRLEAAINQLI